MKFSILRKNHTAPRPRKQTKKILSITIPKRQKFVLAVLILSVGLFLVGNNQTGQYALHIALTLAIVTDIFLLWGIYSNLRENFNASIFILPFFYSLSSGMFYFLVPARLLFRIPVAIIYGIGLYSLFLSQNVFIVATNRVIALLAGARIVSFLITILSYFLITDIVFSLHLPFLPMIFIVALYSYLLVYQSIRTYVLQKIESESIFFWSAGVTLCLVEAAALLWFWPSSPTIIAIFLAGFFSTLAGLSHTWFERRLFRGVLWEYLWVGAVVFFVLIAFTQWGK